MIFQFAEDSVNVPDPMTLLSADDGILTYGFTSGIDDVPEPFTFCLCAEGPLNAGGLGGNQICCDLSITLGNPEIVSYNATTGTYRIEVTITNTTVGVCTDRVVRFTPSTGPSVNLTVGVNSVLIQAPIEGGSVELHFVNVCSGADYLAAANLPGIPCCPATSVIDPLFTFVSQDGTNQRIRGTLQFAYTGTAGCVRSNYYVRGTGLNQLLTVGANTFDFLVPIAGGSYMLEVISDQCADIDNTFTFTIPAVSCCPFSVQLTSLAQTYDPIADELDIVATIVITESGTGCVTGPYSFQSIYHTQALTAGSNIVSFSAPNTDQNIAIVITQDCSGQPFSRMTIPTTEQECCAFIIVADDSGPVNVGGTVFEHTITVVPIGGNCYDSDNYEVEVLNTGQTIILGAFDSYTFTSDLGSLTGTINYYGISACGSEDDLDWPFGSSCCTLSIQNVTDVFPSGLPTPPGFTNYQVDMDLVDSCVQTYEVFIDGVSYATGVGSGAYTVQFDLPENTSGSRTISFVSDCDGASYGFIAVWQEPPCCAVGGLTITTTRIADTLTGPIPQPTYQVRVTGAAQTLGCDVSDFFLTSNVFSTRQITPALIPSVWGNANFTFTIDPMNPPASTEIEVSSVCAGTLGTYSRDLPDCCSTNLANTQLLGTLQYVLPDAVTATITAGFAIPANPNNCVAEQFILSTPHGLFYPINHAIYSQPILVTHPVGATDITFTLTSSCSGEVRTLTLPIPTPPCCPLDLSVVSLLPTGRIEATSLGRLEYTLTLDLQSTLPSGCAFTPNYTLLHESNVNDSSIPLAGVPITAGINTFNVFVKATTFNWNLRVNSCCGCAQFDTLVYVPPVISSLTNCCPITIVGVPIGNPIPLTLHAGNIFKFDVEFTNSGVGCLQSPVRFYAPALNYNFTQVNTGHCAACTKFTIGNVDINTPTTVYMQFPGPIPPSGTVIPLRYESFCLASIALPFSVQMP